MKPNFLFGRLGRFERFLQISMCNWKFICREMTESFLYSNKPEVSVFKPIK